MLNLKQLNFKGIGRFVDEQTISFDSLGNLVQVDGLRSDTGGSSGSGKTTVFNALDYLFGISNLPNKILQSRLTKEAISVTGEFDYNGKNLTISRNKKGLSIKLGDTIISGSSKLSEEKLEQIIGIPKHLFSKLLHKRQKEGGFFLDFTPKQMYEFLIDCLDLGEFKDKLDKVELKIKELYESLNSKVNEYNRVESAHKATQDSILSLGEAPVKDMHEEVIVKLKKKYDASVEEYKKTESEVLAKKDNLNNLIKNLKNEHQVKITEFQNNSPIAENQVYDISLLHKYDNALAYLAGNIYDLEDKEKERLQVANRLVSELTVKINDIEHKIIQGNSAMEEAKKLAEQIKKIRASICPTCEQSWVTETAKTKESEILEQIDHYKKIIFQAKEAEQEKVLLSKQLKQAIQDTQNRSSTEIDGLKAKKDEVEKLRKEEEEKRHKFDTDQYKRNTDLINQFNKELQAFRDSLDSQLSSHYNRLDLLNKENEAIINQYKGQVEIDKATLDSAVSKFKLYRESKERYDNAFKSMNEKLSEYANQMKNIDKEIEKLKIDLALAEEAKLVVKSYTSCSFEDALASISDMATKIIRNIPNMSNATIELEALKETASGKIKEEVNAVISMGGEIGIPIKSLSGGERSSVDLCVDLAVIDMIESKTNKGINIFILDEPFTGLDVVSIEMALEVLKSSNINKKLIIVDHNETVKEMVDNRIIVNRQGQTSNIIQA